MASNTSWNKFIKEQETHDAPLASEQLSALSSLSLESNISVSEIARQITAPILRSLERKPDSTVDCYRLWRTVADAVKELTDYNDKLVELVVEIQKVPDTTGYITDMQDFRQHWTEFAFKFDDPPSTDPQRAAKRHGWVNLNAFSAKLSAKGIPQLDERSRAGAVLRDTLEKTPWENYHHADIDNEEDLDDEDFPAWKAHQLELRDVRSLNGSVPAASMWIKFNGNGIYEMKGEMEDEYDYDKTNWTGPKGWSKERFRYWQERFEWISKVTALDKETREAAREAADLMKGIQSAN